MAALASAPSTRLLLVEGADDENVTKQICARGQADIQFAISDSRGVDKLIPSIEFTVRQPGLSALGILVDANDNLQERWIRVADQLRRAGVQPPPTPDPNGTIIDGKPRVGIWLMPDNASPGQLEDFVVRMIPDDDPIWPLARRYIGGIPPADRKFVAAKAPTAQLYAWLATREHPRLMGWAVRDEDLDVDGDLCRRFVDWLGRLFD